ncbi:HNH endonuclease signature motif containing protein [Paenibacillus lupini]|uniref:HNH endonuclease n=1 Tax=Paenibacillus lupini TaxID=1450204 RepID=UPI00141F1D42|nr:HNH endonuclease signature motif containing protein [Paenibacillus lupini]NIK24185.1 trigger factor [Paenibacillus lupini]
MQERPPIPEPMKREVRQRCGFGCVICGLPIYQYDHMKEWAIVKEHKAEDLTLLCPQHHTEVTHGLLSRESVFSANKDPINLRHGQSRPLLLHYNDPKIDFIIGSNIVSWEQNESYKDFAAIVVDMELLLGFSFEDGNFGLHMNILDSFNKVVLTILNNELIYSSEVWDIQFVGKSLTIREGHRNILIKFTFEPPHKVIVENGHFLCNGVELTVTPTHMAHDGGLIIGGQYSGKNAAFVFGRRGPGLHAARYYADINRYKR